MLALDVFRPAAYEQLTQLGAQINVPVFGNPKEKNAFNIIKHYENELKKFDVIIADSSGRDALKKDMIDEITSVEKMLKPNEILLVQGADIGQGAKEQAEAFKNALKITGVVITKLDGTAKGGGAITSCSIANAKIKFIGVGEKINDIEAFDPKRFVSRLLGLGDLEALLEKAKELAAEKAPDKEMEKRIMSGKFNLDDYAAQLESMSKMGSISKLVNMIPGMGMANIPKDMLNLQEGKLKKFKHILNSMTLKEKEDPEILHRSRLERIAKGSGTEVSDVKELINQFNQIKKFMKGMKGKDVQKLAKRFGGKLPKMPFGM
jgi:signal recognition particle subunit SRP54